MSSGLTAQSRSGTFDELYRQLLLDLLGTGHRREDRTGCGTWSLFARTLELDLQEGFPLLSLRHVSFRIVLLEQLWMLRGITGTQWLRDRKLRIWEPWATSDGDIGPTIGAQWRQWALPNGAHKDQVLALMESLRQRPHSRRHLLSAWNLADLPQETLSPHDNVRNGRMALAPCIVTHQFYVEGDRLSLLVHQRSADTLLGLPLDVAGSALLVHLFARILELEPHRLIVVMGDVHLYCNHRDQANTLLNRDARGAPQLVFHTPAKLPFAYNEGDVEVSGYESHPAIAAPIPV